MKEDVFRSILRPRVRESLPKPLVEASDVRLARALVENHRAWRVRLARAGKGVVHTRSGLDWMLTPDGETGLAITGMAEEEAEAQLVEAFALFSRKRNPLDVVVTAGQNSGPRDLIGRLVAWGFQPEFQVGMAVDVNALNKRVEFPKGLKLSFCEDVSAVLNGRAKVWTKAQTMRPRRVWHIQAVMKRRPVGIVSLHISGGVAGVYDVMVLPEYQKQGFGTALVMGACLFAKKLGYQYCVLAAGETELFRRVGFYRVSRFLYTVQESTGLRGRPNDRDLEIACAASVGERGRFCKLLREYPKAMTWRSRMGLTPLHVAIASGRPDFACWLIDRGAKADEDVMGMLK